MLGFLKALAVYIGTIIGVGIFGLPYIASKAGFFLFFLFLLLLCGLVIIIQLIFGEICLETEGTNRLPGYIGKYLGNNWKNLSFLIISFGFFGSCLAYLIIGGEFLGFLFSPYFGGSNLIYTLIFFFIGSYLIFRGIKAISQIELSLLAVFFIILIIFFFKALPFINVDYLRTIDWKFFTLPYGIIFFSLWGSAVIPEIKEMVKGDRRQLKKIIISGVLLSAVIYLLFVFIILSVSGSYTSENAISGFAMALGDSVIKVGFLFGIIACFTSFLTIGLTLKKVFWYDFGLSKNLSGFIACFLPLFLFLIGMRQFIDIISLTGALAIGGESIMIILLYKAFLQKKFSRRINPLLYVLLVFLILGVGSQIFYLTCH